MTVHETLEHLEIIGDIWWSTGGYLTEKELDERTSLPPWTAARSFVNILFQRQGGTQYIPIARKVLEEIGEDPKADTVWERFKEVVDASDLNGVNAKCNPLRKDETSDVSMVDFIHDHGNPYRWARGIAEDEGSPRDVAKALETIPGVGQKISALFTRDIWTVYGPETVPVEEAAYVHPMDTWVKKGARILLRVDGSVKKRELARGLHNEILEAHVDPYKVNAGMWMLGREFAEDDGEFHRLMGGEGWDDFVKREHEKAKVRAGMFGEAHRNRHRADVVCDLRKG